MAAIRVASLVPLCLLGGCATSNVVTDEGRFSVETGLHRALPSQDTSLRVPAGTEVCPELDNFFYEGLWQPQLDGVLGDTCYDIVSLDSLEDENGCFVLEDPGPARFRLEPELNCLPLGSLAPDTFTLHVRPTRELRARIIPGLDAQGFSTFLEPGGQPLARGLLPPEGEPMRVVAGSTVWIAPLVLDAEDQPVAFDFPPSAHAFHATRGSFEEYSASDRDLPEEEILVRLDAESVVTIAVPIPDRMLAAGTLVAVPQSDAASLSLQAAVLEPGDPSGALRAVIRDAEGRVLFGSEVEWSSEGTPVEFGALTNIGGPDYAYFSDVCLAPPESPTARSVVFTASLDGLTDSLTYSWIAQPDPEALEGFEPGSLCPPQTESHDDSATARGCGCSRGGSDFSWLVAIAGLAFVCRRRSAAAPYGTVAKR